MANQNIHNKRTIFIVGILNEDNENVLVMANGKPDSFVVDMKKILKLIFNIEVGVHRPQSS